MQVDPLVLNQIGAVLVRISYLADYGTLDEYLANLTADARWTITSLDGTSHTDERAAIEAGIRRRRAQGLQGPGSGARHVVTTVQAVLNEDGTALALSYFTMFHHITSDPRIVSMGRYHDLLRRNQDGDWQIISRTVTRD